MFRRNTRRLSVKIASKLTNFDVVCLLPNSLRPAVQSKANRLEGISFNKAIIVELQKNKLSDTIYTIFTRFYTFNKRC